MLTHYLDIAAPYLDRYGYFAVFGTVLVEGFGLPAPGQTLIIAGGLLAARGQMHIAVLMLVAWTAAVLGDNIGYAIGRYGGRQWVLRHGGRAGLRAAHLHHVERFFARYGGGIVIVARFVEVLRQLNGVVAGLGGMSWPRFLGFNALGAALWVGVWGYGVYRLGRHMEQVLSGMKQVEPYLVGAGVLAVCGLLVYLLRRGNGDAS